MEDLKMEINHLLMQNNDEKKIIIIIMKCLIRQLNVNFISNSRYGYEFGKLYNR